VAEIAVSNFARIPSPLSVIAFQQFGGKVSRIGKSKTAFCHRDAQYDHLFVSIWNDPSESETQMKCAREWWEAMKPFSLGGEYINNLGEEGEDRVRASYGVNYDRLVALKNKYDPTNFFRLNANIKPTL